MTSYPYNKYEQITPSYRLSVKQKIKIIHGKFKLTTANSNSPRQFEIHYGKIQIRHSKFKFTMANSNSLWQIQIHHGKFKFATAKFKFTAANSNLQRQIQLNQGKFKFATANSSPLRQTQHRKFTFTRQIQIHHGNSNSPRQIQIYHVKFKFTTANSVSRECRHGLQGEDGRGWARDSEGRAWSPSFFYQL